MNMNKLRLGEMFVIEATEINPRKNNKFNKCVVWVNDDFPLDAFNKMVDMGFFSVRKPTEQEKEYCFFCYENIGTIGCNLDGMKQWIEFKIKKG